MIEISLPSLPGKFYLHKKRATVYAEDKSTAIIYLDRRTNLWNYLLSYPVLQDDVVQLLNEKMGNE